MISDQAYVLHKRPFKDSSELIKVLGKHSGVMDLISKGSRNPKSKFKGQLQPFIESQISYSGRSELKTLIHSEQVGVNPACAYLNHVSMLYCNELILLLTFNEDYHAELFELYALTIKALKSTDKVSLILRQFEWRLCCSQGYQLSLPKHIKPTDYVAFCPINGLVVSDQHNPCKAASFSHFVSGQVMSSLMLNEINHLMRTVIDHMVHGKTIQSRALLIKPTAASS